MNNTALTFLAIYFAWDILEICQRYWEMFRINEREWIAPFAGIGCAVAGFVLY